MSRESNLPLFFYPHYTTIVVHNRYKKLHKWYDLGIAIYYNSSIIELTKEITPQEVNVMNTITVKEVKGCKIQKYENTKGQYFVNIWTGHNDWNKAFYVFKTIKSAVEFINKAL